MPSKRVTLKQVAEVAGVHPTTVSMALRNHPRIPEKTRNRLKKLAEEMGYVPDPMLASLNAYRHSSVEKTFLSKIAWLNISLDPEWPNKTTFVREYYKGAVDRAHELGYELEVFGAHPNKIPTKRLQQILLSRSIQGIIIAPVQRNYPEAVSTLDLDWDKFCSITFGYSFEAPEINRVTTDHYHSVIETMEQLHALGYKRPGMFMSRKNNARIDRLWEAGYLVGMRTKFESDPLPVVLYEPNDNKEEVLRKWYEKNRPDAIIAQDFKSVKQALQDKIINVPDDCQLVFLEETEPGFSYIEQNHQQIGATAVSLLVGALQRHDHGLPQTPNVTLLKGFWNKG